MNALAFVHHNALTAVKPHAISRGLLVKAQATVAVIGLAGSAIVSLSGSLLIAASWLVANESVQHWLSTAGSVLIFLTIPLIALAALCMDWIEKDEQQRWPKTTPYDDEDEQ